jgi:hypothetical protein
MELCPDDDAGAIELGAEGYHGRPRKRAQATLRRATQPTNARRPPNPADRQTLDGPRWRGRQAVYKLSRPGTSGCPGL